MNIIFVSNNMAKAKTLSVWQVGIVALVLISLPVLIAFLVIVPQDVTTKQGVKSLISAPLKFSFNNKQKHLDAYAMQLGEMQARMMRLDAQSERLAKLAGEKKPVPSDKIAPSLSVNPGTSANPPQTLNRGGPLVLNTPVTEKELEQKIAGLMAQIEFHAEYYNDLEAKLLQRSVLKDTLPNRSPIAAAFNSSSYGWRLDPFNGHKAFHEGLDFTADTGTAIYAAAGGIVAAAGHTADYGKIVKIDHGSGLETRYAHASKLLVNAGDRVEKGQKVAEVGSTGRSTGPHLHYEIRLNGNPLDPKKYLSASR
ncbi:MAG: peptidase M23 [Methylotenera sp.]|nr:MAG: peptidase M23 [Methylotenera sp.]